MISPVLPARALLLLLLMPAAPRRFDVVSIRPSKPTATMQDMRIAFPPARMEAVNITLGELLLSFTGFSGKVEGGPKWVTSDRYDIIAKADGEIKSEERGPMLMALLEERFHLAIHHESREQSGLALTKGKQEPDVKPATEGEPVLGHLDERRQVVFRNARMSDLAGYLRGMLSTPVTDRTGMTGRYDFSLDPDSFAAAPDEPFRDRIRSAVAAIGFKLETQKVVRDITVIDHAERPTEN